MNEKKISSGRQPGQRRRTASKDGPDPIDVHVGRRLRQARILADLSQEQLGEAIGVSFQAVQKYETGENRLSASRLLRAARTLARSLAFFFEDIEEAGLGLPQMPTLSREELEMVRHWRSIGDDQVRTQMLLLVKKMGSFA